MLNSVKHKNRLEILASSSGQNGSCLQSQSQLSFFFN